MLVQSLDEKIADTSYNGPGQNLTANENLPFLKYLANVQKKHLDKKYCRFCISVQGTCFQNTKVQLGPFSIFQPQNVKWVYATCQNGGASATSGKGSNFEFFLSFYNDTIHTLSFVCALHSEPFSLHCEPLAIYFTLFSVSRPSKQNFLPSS